MTGGDNSASGSARLVFRNLTNSIFQTAGTATNSMSSNKLSAGNSGNCNYNSMKLNCQSLTAGTDSRHIRSISDAIAECRLSGEENVILPTVNQHHAQVDTEPIGYHLTPCKTDFRPVLVVNIDADSGNQYLEASQYAFYYHRRCMEMEEAYMTKISFLNRHPEITEKMRAILIDWLVDVHGKYQLNSDVIFRTVSIMDRFIEKGVVARNELQLVGITALWISAKVEQQDVPDACDLAELTQWAYNSGNVAEMESRILNTLNFYVSAPHSLTFVRRLQKVCTVLQVAEKDMVYDIVRYAIELALLKVEMLAFRPSETAAAAFLLAFHLCKVSVDWDDTWVCYSGGWTITALKKCERLLLKLVIEDAKPNGNSRLEAVKRKFSSRRYGNISSVMKRSVSQLN